MSDIVRGTTPTIRYTFSTIDTANLVVAKLVIFQINEAMITKELTDATIGTDYVEWTLAQADTLSLEPSIDAVIKLDWLLNDGTRGIGHSQKVNVLSSAINEVI